MTLGALQAQQIRTLKAHPLEGFDWSGWYVGGHFGAATTSSDWTSTGAANAVIGKTDLTEGFNLFKGSGSFTGGLHGGYNRVLPSRVMLGLEADATFPNLIAGTGAASGIASYDNTVLHLGSARARAGYVLRNDWLLYGTAGFTWSYDQLKRTELAGITLAPDTDESRLLWRYGWTAGAGVEVPVAAQWTARLEYLYSDFGARTKIFPEAQEAYRSDLMMHQLRAGLTYRLQPDGAGKDTAAFTAPGAYQEDIWALHAQTTFVEQYAAPFRAPYRGQNSLGPNQGRETFDATAYLGFRPWTGGEIWINPEIDQGFGLSGTLGVAGFLSGEAYKKGADYPYTRIHRAFLRQTIDLGDDVQKVDAAINQFATKQSSDRLVVTVGKFSVGDIFDTNKYAHDPRSDFLNWSIIDAGTFDYAAEAWGYTLGAAAEWYHGAWTLRGGVFDMSIVPNSTDLDPRFGQFQWVGEIEHRHDLFGQPGKVALTGYLSRGRMGNFQDAIALAQITGGAADISSVRRYRSRGGAHVNLEQQLAPDIGFFARAGIANGNTEPYEFTDIDRTLSAGFSVAGARWQRPDDTFGIAGVANGITGVHKSFLDAGGLGILVGDGQLPRPGTEHIIETYYSFPAGFGRITLDYQFVNNPAYNRDRGPVSVFATRLHAQF